MTNWVRFFAPAGTPPDVVALERRGTFKGHNTDAGMQARLLSEGPRFIPMSAEQFGAFVAKGEIAKWRQS